MPARRGERARSAAATGSSPTSCTQVATPSDPRGEQDRRREPRRRSASTSPRGTAELGDFDAFVPLSARTGDGRRRAASPSSRPGCRRGRVYYPDGVVSDQPETALVAELRAREAARDRPRRAAALDRRSPPSRSRTTRRRRAPSDDAEDERRRSCATGSSCGSSATPRRGS